MRKWVGIDITENMSYNNSVAKLNPFRYRGYYYDAGTGLYYLNSRYYDPSIGRFINADDISYIQPTDINGLNLFAYCANNPIMRNDPEGTAWWHWLLGIGVALVAAAITVVSLGAAGIAIGGMAGAIIHGAAVGALIGAGFGAVGGAVAGGIYSAVTGEDFWTSVGVGAAAGFGIGAIIGAVVGGTVGGLKFHIRGFGPKEIQTVVKNVLNSNDKMSHILQAKHKLPTDINKVGKLMKKTLSKGQISTYKAGPAKIATWFKAKSQITFRIMEGIIKISDFWIF